LFGAVFAKAGIKVRILTKGIPLCNNFTQKGAELVRREFSRGSGAYFFAKVYSRGQFKGWDARTIILDSFLFWNCFPE
jgi:hypothetical protein